jgi:hypothetical protein
MDEIYKEKYLKYKAKYNAFKRRVARKLKGLSKLKMPKGDPKMVKSLETLRANNLAGNLERNRPVVAPSVSPLLSPLSPLTRSYAIPPINPIVPLYPIQRNYLFVNADPTPSVSSSVVSAPVVPKRTYPYKLYQIVYGVFNKDIGQKLNLIKSKVTIPDEYVDKTFIKTITEAHTSIVYEPEYISNTEADLEKVIASIPKYTSTADLNNEKMYPGFLELLSRIDKIDDLVLVGANAFFRENRVIIKVTFNSEKMNAIRKFLYSLPSMEKYKAAWVERLTRIAPVLRSKYSKSKYFEEDKTFAELPEGWIHHTVGVVKDNIPIDKLDKIIDDVNRILFELGFVKGKTYSIDELKLRTHDLNHFLIWEKRTEPELK